jgi:hypothetical protein
MIFEYPLIFDIEIPGTDSVPNLSEKVGIFCDKQHLVHICHTFSKALKLATFKLFNLRISLHIPSILATDLIKRMGNLTQGTIFRRLHQSFEDIPVAHSYLLQFGQFHFGTICIPLV